MRLTCEWARTSITVRRSLPWDSTSEAHDGQLNQIRGLRRPDHPCHDLVQDHGPSLFLAVQNDCLPHGMTFSLNSLRGDKIIDRLQNECTLLRKPGGWRMMRLWLRRRPGQLLSVTVLAAVRADLPCSALSPPLTAAN